MWKMHLQVLYCAKSLLFPLREYSENNENYIEMPLVFNPVAREDLDTDFKCMVLNTQSLQTLHATVREGMHCENNKGNKKMLNVL